MSRQDQSAKKQSITKSQPKPKSVSVVEKAREVATGYAWIPFHPTTDDHLSARRLTFIQRQELLSKIGYRWGNRHLQHALGIVPPQNLKADSQLIERTDTYGPSLDGEGKCAEVRRKRVNGAIGAQSIDMNVQDDLAHVLQQRTMNSPVIQRFDSSEHVEIGNRALPGKDVLIVGYGRVLYGEMIAMAGDYFESLAEMQALVQSYGRFGIEQIDFARWKVNPSRPRPNVGSDVEDAVMDRYYELAGRNETHFSIGSAPGQSNREQYIAAHTKAIQAAFREGMSPLTVGLGWEAQEAFASHFLTDAFSAGHIRTPRKQIQEYWQRLYPNFRSNLIQMISCYMASYINARDTVGYFKTVRGLSEDIAPEIIQRGGSALSVFSIGDLISKVIHDADNRGLDVVSGSKSPFQWKAVGDGSLYPSTPNAAATQTQHSVEEAVLLSYEEARQAWSAGVSGDGGLSVITNPANFHALNLVPSTDNASTTNPTYDWQAASIQMLPTNLRTLLLEQFQPGNELRRGLDEIEVPAVTTRFGFSLHTGNAWNYFRQLLLANPLSTIERIGNGDVCPPGS